MRLIINIFILTSSFWASAQVCPSLISPLNGETDVPVDARIVWEQVEGVTGFIVSVGTTPGGIDIVNEQANGSSNFIQPRTGLPENTEIYVTITLFSFNRPNIVCTSESFITEEVTTIPECSTVLFPADGAVDINVATNINWQYASKATGYRISLGATPGGSEVINNQNVGNRLTFNPPNDLLPNTLYFVTIIPYNENGNAVGCSESSFTTGQIAALPSCTQLITPINGATNVPLSPLVEWQTVPDANGYRVFIGKTPDENNILDGGVFTNTSTFVFNFEDNNVYFVRIVPFNAAGDAIGCSQETFSTILGCGPYFDPVTGELVNLRPEINFPEQVGICTGETEVFTSEDEALGYRWYKDNFSEELLISSTNRVEISETGNYILELFNETEDGSLQCKSRQEFEVVSSEAPTINDVEVEELDDGVDIRIMASGNGDYEYALSPDGPYQDENSFINASLETEFVYVRDKNGCGVEEFQMRFPPNNEGFPKFFTPNGDGFNDRWQYKAKATDNFNLIYINIFNRYGKLLKSISPNGSGWDGTFAGSDLPTSDYWYKAETSDGRIFTGHFSLRK